MRYYGIRINSAPAPFRALPWAHVTGAQWCSVVGEKNDPGAQQVEFDLTEFRANDSTPNCTVTIQNPSLDQLSQMAYLKDLSVDIHGGMWKGLPLATSHYDRGLTGWLMSGVIQRCWGSWVGTDMSLSFAFSMTENADTKQLEGQAPSTGGGGGDAGPSPPAPDGGGGGLRFARVGPRSLYRNGVLRAAAPPTATQQGIDFGSGFSAIGGITSFLFGGGGTLASPLNIIHNLMPNQPLADAIKQTLSTAFKGAKANIKISPDLKLPSQDAGMFQSLTQYAAYLQQVSQGILGSATKALGSAYQGIVTSSHGAGLDIHDGTQDPTSVALPITVYDLIGQPTWIGPFQVQFKVVMRCDIHIDSEVTLPPTLLMGVEASAGLLDGQSARAGVLNFASITGRVSDVRHIGDFRNPDGNAWCTMVTMTVPDNVTTFAGDIAKIAGTAARTLVSAFAPSLVPNAAPSTALRRTVRRYG